MLGIPRYSSEIQKRMPGTVFNNITCPWASGPVLGGILKGVFLPVAGFRHSVKGRIKHIASQGYAFTAPFLRTGPVVLTCHDLIPWTYYHIRTPTWKANVRSIRQIEHIIAISEYTKKELVDHLEIPEGRIHVIPNGIDHQKFHPVADPVRPEYLKPEDRVLLYVGFDERRKNLGVVLQALADLSREFPGVKLVKAGGLGGSRYRDACISEIKRLGLEKQVIFTGRITDTELVSLYNSADALVFPSLMEGFGLPALEAMACGCPVIASDRTAIPEVVGDAGILLDPEDPEAWCTALSRVLDEPATREEMKQKSLRRAALFSWDTCAQKTGEIYCTIENNS
ncbi:MAG: glycosyltransferase family 4 protein [Methanoregula sp.]|jgi:glycosyltransferase involved in cell wall biosynthesis|nr:glycosyltransferase family 4 protein [Methanoregula sp.]